eukprot:scaffold64583_cov48-Phaeocystis_antarctica.AAC.1
MACAVGAPLARLHMARCAGVTDKGLAVLGKRSGVTELNLAGCEHVSDETCNPTRQRLQPHVPEAATPRARGCNPTCQRLQPHASRRLRPHASRLRPHASRLRPHASRLRPRVSRPRPHVYQVGDEGVSCLAQLARLKRLDLGGAPLVSQRALQALQAALPSCHLGPCGLGMRPPPQAALFRTSGVSAPNGGAPNGSGASGGAAPPLGGGGYGGGSGGGGSGAGGSGGGGSGAGGSCGGGSGGG